MKRKVDKKKKKEDSIKSFINRYNNPMKQTVNVLSNSKR